MEGSRFGLVDNWLHHVQDVYEQHQDILAPIEDKDSRSNKLCELNAIEQVINVCRSASVRDAWKRGQPLTIYGVIYDVRDGILRNLNITIDSLDAVQQAYDTAIAALDHVAD